jgi:outer membrane protein
MNKKWISALVLAGWVVAIGASQARALEKMAVVDIQRVLDTVEEGKKAKSDFEKAMKGKKDELQRKQTELQKLTEDFEKQKLVLSASALGEKEKALQAKQMEFQQTMMTAQKEMQEKEVTLTGQILKRIRGVVEKIGQEDAYDFVFEKGQVVYVKNAFDLTDRVIKTYDKTYKP